VQIEQDARNLSVESSTELIELSKRPLLAALVQMLLVITRDLVSSLVIITEAETVLTSDSSEWPSGEVLVPPVRGFSFMKCLHLLILIHCRSRKYHSGNVLRQAHCSS